MNNFAFGLFAFVLSFSLFAQTDGQFSDPRDGKIYRTKSFVAEELGEKLEITWMIDNFRFDAVNSICYNRKKSNCEKYGRLYTWNSLSEVCPRGWHMLSYDDLVLLKEYYEHQVNQTFGTVENKELNIHKIGTLAKYLKAELNFDQFGGMKGAWFSELDFAGRYWSTKTRLLAHSSYPSFAENEPFTINVTSSSDTIYFYPPVNPRALLSVRCIK